MTMDTTASPGAGLRRVAIDPVSRVEGHGRVTLLVDEHQRVAEARLHIVEFRGFESFIRGRPYWEVPVIVQRLCGICPVSHHLAASKAIDAALGVAPAVPHAAQQLRRLMHYAQILQSHATHFFHLASPDLLFGFDSEATRRHIVAVAAAHPETARQGVLLRKFGQEVIKATAGKRVHGTGSVPGGVNRCLTHGERDQLVAQVPQIVAWCEAAADLAEALQAQQPALYAGFAAFESGFLSLVRPGDGAMALYDGVLRARGPDGAPWVDDEPVERYLDLIEEAVRPWSYMKFPYLRARGPEAGWYRVGPLARLQTCSHVPTPRAEARRAAFVAGGPVFGSLAYHGARMIEMLHAAETIGALLADDAVCGEGAALATPVPAGRRGEVSGVGVIEAPRGTLIHHYAIGEDDLVTGCNLIVSTTHNNEAMHAAVRQVADESFDGREIDEAMLNRIEVAIRAYDPCLSCATHALGSMPLEVALVDAGGQPRGGLLRHGDGRVERLEGPEGRAATPDPSRRAGAR
jgi:NAD-reducing hydrogenase large subunit